MPSVWFGKKSLFILILDFLVWKPMMVQPFWWRLKKSDLNACHFVANMIEQWKGGEVIDLSLLWFDSFSADCSIILPVISAALLRFTLKQKVSQHLLLLLLLLLLSYLTGLFLNCGVVEQDCTEIFLLFSCSRLAADNDSVLEGCNSRKTWVNVRSLRTQSSPK